MTCEGAPEQQASTAMRLASFIEAFSTRPDVRVTVSSIGGPAREAALEGARAAIPAELLAFHREMDGAHFEWAFVEPPGGGRIRIPPLSKHSRFQTDDALFTAFGEGRTALLVDEVQPEGASWYVRGPSASLDDAVIWFGPAGREREGKLVARSLADYVDQAIQNAFVVWWPLPDPETGEWIARANAPSRAPAVISEGGRVQSAYYSEEGRGIVSALHTVTHAEHSSLRAYGAEYALVTMDEGTTLWSPIQTLKAVSQVDAYEEARTSGDAFWSALDTLPMIDRIVEVARAIGPLTSYRGAYPSNARRAAGLLSTLSLDDAARVIGTAFSDAGRSGIDLAAGHPIGASSRDFASSDWSYTASFVPKDILEGLVGGLAWRLAQVSAANARAPRELMTATAIAGLRWVPGRTLVMDHLSSTTPLDAPAAVFVDTDRARTELGLPGPHPVGLGNGM